jgi:gas vesicle protein
MWNHANNNTKEFLIGAAVGGIVGATTALLLAPTSGTSLRNSLMRMTAKRSFINKKKQLFGHIKKAKRTAASRSK